MDESGYGFVVPIYYLPFTPFAATAFPSPPAGLFLPKKTPAFRSLRGPKTGASFKAYLVGDNETVANEILNARYKQNGIKRLGEKVVRSQLQTLHTILRLGEPAGDHDHRRAAKQRIFLDHLAHLEAGHIRQLR